MPLLRVADIQTRDDDYGDPFVAIEEINGALDGSDYSIQTKTSTNGYTHTLVVEADDD